MEIHTDPEEQMAESVEEESALLEDQPKLKLSDYAKNYAALLFLSGGILLLDQWTKSWVRTNLGLYESWMPIDWLAPYVRIINAENTGAAFGMFKQGGGLFTILAIIVSLVIIYYFPQIPKKDWPVKLALSLQLGGALGNLYDRLFYGPVTDFIAVGRFPVFNVSDSSIFVGVAILIAAIWITERNEKIAKKLEMQDSRDIELGEQA